MQKIKAMVFENFQIEHKKMINIKALPRNPAFQAGVAALISIGLLLWLHIRPLGLTFLLIFGFWFYKNRCNLRIQTPPELEKHLKQIQQRVAEFRQTKPTMFCAIASGCLGALAVVGHLVSGSMVVLAGLVFAAIVSTKYNFKIMKIEQKDLDFAWSEKLQQEYELDDEFMPEENETNMFVLERASDLASLTLPTEDPDNDEDKSDEVPSDLLLPDSIPEIDENSSDDDQDDLLPVVQVYKSETRIKNSNPAKNSSVVKYSQSENIEFKKGHFKRDSSLSTTSSSSEESLSKNLKFPDPTAVDGTTKKGSSTVVAKISPVDNQEANDLVALAVRSQTQALLANSSKLIPSLVSGLVQGVLNAGAGALATQGGAAQSTNRRIVTALDSSDESDFEILEEEDFE